MTPIQQCLQSLAVLAKSDDLNGISLAESKIDEFVRTAGTESAWQIVALDDLKHNNVLGAHAGLYRPAARRDRRQVRAAIMTDHRKRPRDPSQLDEEGS